MTPPLDSPSVSVQSPSSLPKVEAIEFKGLPAFRLTAASGATAVVSLLGGQVLSWVTPDGRERLFLSERAVFQGVPGGERLPLRGGIPVCFPQFSDRGTLPRHGLLRTRFWEEDSQSTPDGAALLTLACQDDADTREIWPYGFRAELTVALEGDRLDVELGIDNTGEESFGFTGALHTYLAVGEVEECALEGLYGLDYEDQRQGRRVIRETGPSLIFEDGVDRVYRNASRPLLLQHGGGSLGIRAQGFPDVVVWNPWEEGCAAVADLAPLDFRHMLCVEAAQVAAPVVLTPGETWWGRQSLVVL